MKEQQGPKNNTYKWIFLSITLRENYSTNFAKLQVLV